MTRTLPSPPPPDRCPPAAPHMPPISKVDGSEEKRRGIPLQQVECLMFSFKHILRIDNLHGLGRLVKLQVMMRRQSTSR